MPNWCSNKLKISGHKDKVAEFAATLVDGNFRFSQTFPRPAEPDDIITGATTIDGKQVRAWRRVDGKEIEVSPEELADLQTRYNATDWYQWSLTNWGTKWDLDDDVEADVSDPEAIYVYFDTACSPPVAWMLNASKMFPLLTFQLFFSEGGAAYYGSTTCYGGQIIKNNYSEKFWRDDADDYMDNLTPECSAFLQRHGLHIGG